MYKRRNRGVGNTTFKPKKGNSFKKIFEQKPKTITPSVDKKKSQTGSKVKHSVTTLLKNKIKKSKLNVKGIAQTPSVDKKRSHTGSKIKHSVTTLLKNKIKKSKLNVKDIAQTPSVDKNKKKTQFGSKIKHSVTTLLENKIKKSKLNVKDIALIDGMDANDLKKRFSVSGNNAKILDGMVADYKDGKLAVPGLSSKSKSKGKPLDKNQLNKMINEYDGVRRKRDLTEARQNVNQLKKKFSLSKSQEKGLDKMVKELSKGKGSKLELGKILLDPKKLSKDRVQDIVKQYSQGRQKKRGHSHLSGNLLFIVASKEKIHELMSNLSGKLKKLNL